MFYKKTFTILLLLLLSTSLYSQKPYFNGSFIAGYQCASWDDQRWQDEFNVMKELGMSYIVIQAVAEAYPGETTKTYYPSVLPNTETVNSNNSSEQIDIVDACLRNAENLGIKVFIGFSISDYWWQVYASDSTWLFSQMNFDNLICDELWDNYKAKYPNSFYGWYWSYEIENVHFNLPEQQYVLTKAINIQLDHMTNTNKRLPFMVAPFMNSKYGTAESYKQTWIKLFSALNFIEGDIFCPQDGVGAGGLQIDEVSDWFSALKQAVDTKAGLKMWSDVETFEIYGKTFISSSIGRVVSQLNIEKPYVENYITWEYLYYYSPYSTSSGYIDTYKDYLTNNMLDSSKPSTPSNLNFKILPGNVIEITWDASTDNIGICGYKIYRNDKIISKFQVGLNDTTGNINNYYRDSNVDPGTTYTYNVQAYDFAGNSSDISSVITIKTNDINKISVGCSYQISTTPSDNYPDQNHTKLTDGKFASIAYYADHAWVGFISPGIIDVVIDLGKIIPVEQFLAEYLLDPQPAVYLPDSVVVAVSNDGQTYEELGTMNDSSLHDTLLSSIHKYYYTLENQIDVRYVKFSTHSPNGAWVFVDEYQVFSSSLTDLKSQYLRPIQEFNIFNNYPNPFNPSTTINLSLNTSEKKMSLKIYNMLGQLVKIVDEGYKAAGTYSYDVNMNNLASGGYFYRLQVGNNIMTKKMMFLK